MIRVDLEHRDLERLADQAQVLRDIVDSPRGWGHIIEAYAKEVAAHVA